MEFLTKAVLNERYTERELVSELQMVVMIFQYPDEILPKWTL